MKTLPCTVFLLVVCLTQYNDGFLFGSKSKNKCPIYEQYENKAISCLLRHEAAFESKDIKERCKAYRESSRCMTPLLEVNRDCGLSAPVDVYNSFTTYQYLKKNGVCQ